MKYFKILGAIAFVAIALIIWNISVSNKKGVKYLEPFAVGLNAGYVWGDGDAFGSRRIWDNTSAYWKPGQQHLNYHVVSSSTEGEWIPLPGYSFFRDGSLETRWNPGTSHPKYKAVADETPGSWKPNPGYTFSTDLMGETVTVWKPGLKHPGHQIYSVIQEGTWRPYMGYLWDNQYDRNDLNVHWSPGQIYPDEKIIADSIEASYIPFPGYEFVDRSKGIAVRWTAGLTHPTNSNYISGSEEGSWNDRYEPSVSEQTKEPSSIEYWINALLWWATAKVGEEIGGKGNSFTNEANKKGAVNLFKGIGQAYKGN